VLIAAEPGHGRRAGLLTDYTFGVWQDGELVPIAKAYSGLTDAEIAEMDRFIRGHTLSRHGPVHTVEPTRVFEIGFEAIQRSTRHKSGIAVRFPRILRIRDDKKPADADRLKTLQALLESIERG
jgi:DNA ligase-1